MAISTYKAFLMKSTDGTTYTKMLDIKDFPDIGGAPEMLETTTLSDGSRTYILGLQEQEAMEFTANYDKATYNSLSAGQNTETYLAVWSGATVSNGVATPNGSNGKFSFRGMYSLSVVGGGVNEVVDMKVTIAPTTPITFA